MAQLIKLQDFISRYEMNVYRYPSQYIRLKKQHWRKLKMQWEEGTLIAPELLPEEDIGQEKKTIFHPLKKILNKKDREQEISESFENHTSKENDSESTEESGFTFEYQLRHQPRDEDELKKWFLNQLFEIQIRWASSTIREKSFVERQFYHDLHLKYFLQRFPDNYLVLYHPVFIIQKAPVELEVILISPIETWCITMVESEEESVLVGSKDRFWTEKHTTKEKKILNPLIGLNRMEKIVQRIYQLNDIELPVRKVVLNRNGYIDYPYGPVDTHFIDKRNYEEWFAGLRRLSSPIKHDQLKAAKGLLQHCQSTFIKRPEWDV
ncbi:nuclease-related domain-containing protein [Bacillus sp. AK128]